MVSSFRIRGWGLRVRGSPFSGLRVSGVRGFRGSVIHGFGFGVSRSGFGVSCSGFGVRGFRVWGFVVFEVRDC